VSSGQKNLPFCTIRIEVILFSPHISPYVSSPNPECASGMISCLTYYFSPSYICILIQEHKSKSKLLIFLALVSVCLVVEKNGFVNLFT
jgi:hypothetical protein